MRRIPIALLAAIVTVFAFAAPAFAQTGTGNMTLIVPATVTAGVPFTVSGYNPQTDITFIPALISSDDTVDGVNAGGRPPVYLIEYMNQNYSSGDYSSKVTLMKTGTVTLYTTISMLGDRLMAFPNTPDPTWISSPVTVNVQPGRYNFSDLAGYENEEYAIYYEAFQGLLPGMTATKFAPGVDVTRAQFATVLQHMLKLKVTSHTTFADVFPKTPGYSAIEAAAPFMNSYTVNNKIDFRPNQRIAREDAWAAVVKAQKALGIITAGEDNAILDNDDVSFYHLSVPSSERLAVGYAIGSGYVTGSRYTSSNLMYPTSPMPRAILAQFLLNVQNTVASSKH